MAQIIFKGSGAPTTTPTKVGLSYIDTAAKVHYKSVGTASSADWQLQGDGDDQTAAQVPFTPNGDIAANDTQAALVEVRDDTDTKLAGKINNSEKGAANGVATLDGSSKIPSGQLPAIALTDVNVVATEVAQLALTVQEGDVAVRTDLNRSYVALNSDNVDMGDWQEMLTPTDAVLSVNSQTGAVSLDTDDISEGATNKYYTEARVDANANVAANTAKNSYPSADATKLAGVEASATADQSNAEIKTAYEANADTNEFSDAEQTKLAGIEAAATADQSSSEIKTAYESNVDTNAYTDAEKTNLGNQSGTNTGDEPAASTTVPGISELATQTEVNTGTDATRTVTPSTLASSDLASDVTTNNAKNSYPSADSTKLAGIEASATADQSNSEIKTAYEANADTNAFDDAEQSKLAGVASGATANDTDANLKARANHTGTQTASTVSDFDTAADARISAQKAAANGLATLDAGSKIPSSQLPAIALTDVNVVANESAQLALTVQEGDVAVRTDLNKSYAALNSDNVDMGDWQELLTPTDTVLSVNSQTGAVSLDTDDISEGVNKYVSAAQKTKLDGIETAATADQSNAEIKTAYEANADTNEFSDAEQTKLAGIEAAATVDQTNAEIKTAYEANADTNALTDAKKTKLDDLPKSKLDATVAPGATDDSGSGYAVGSKWVDVTADKAYVCVDSTASAAVWKDVTASGGADADAIHDNVTAEISAIAEKTTPVNADLLIIEDSAASNAKKRVQIGNLPSGGGSYHAPATLQLITKFLQEASCTIRIAFTNRIQIIYKHTSQLPYSQTVPQKRSISDINKAL